MAIQFRLREIMAERGRQRGKKITYRDIRAAIGTSPNTLSGMAQNRLEMIGIKTIADLCDFLDCEPGELIIRQKNG